MKAMVFVKLLGENSEIWRPVPSEKRGESYTIGGPMPDDEEWEFLPGANVRCERRWLPSAKSAELFAIGLAAAPDLPT